MSSNVAEHVTTLYTLFEVPLISYLSSSPSLSVKHTDHPLVRKTQLSEEWHMKALARVFVCVLVIAEHETLVCLKKVQLDDD